MSNMSQWRCKSHWVLCPFNDITCKSLVVIILRNNNGFSHPLSDIHRTPLNTCVYICAEAMHKMHKLRLTLHNLKRSCIACTILFQMVSFVQFSSSFFFQNTFLLACLVIRSINNVSSLFLFHFVLVFRAKVKRTCIVWRTLWISSFIWAKMWFIYNL